MKQTKSILIASSILLLSVVLFNVHSQITDSADLPPAPPLPTPNFLPTLPLVQDPFSIQIVNSSIKEPLLIEVKDVSAEHLTPLEHFDRITPIFLYDIPSLPESKDPLIFELSFPFSASELRPKHLFYWDINHLTWNRLPTILNQNVASSKVTFPSGIVALFAENIEFPDQAQQLLIEKLTATSAILYDPQTNRILFEKEKDHIQPIASISKLMAALVFLETKPDWNAATTLMEKDNVEGAKLILKPDETIRIRDLFNAALVGSKNNAIMALVRSTGLSSTQFTELMNQKANELAMTNTFFAEPTGLSVDNRSTASDLVKLANAAFSQKIITNATAQTSYRFQTENTKRIISITSTNKMLSEGFEIAAAKTGYTPEANYCLSTKFHLTQGDVYAIVLGSTHKDGHFADMKMIYEQLKKYNQ